MQPLRTPRWPDLGLGSVTLSWFPFYSNTSCLSDLCLAWAKSPVLSTMTGVITISPTKFLVESASEHKVRHRVRCVLQKNLKAMRKRKLANLGVPAPVAAVTPAEPSDPHRDRDTATHAGERAINS